MTMSNNQTTRRNFLRQTGKMAAGVGLGLSLPGVLGAANKRPAPSEHIRIGSIGVGPQGNTHLGLQPVAVCDVDKRPPGRSQGQSRKGQAANLRRLQRLSQAARPTKTLTPLSLPRPITGTR